MKRMILIALALILLCPFAWAEEGVTFGEDLSGVYCYPEGSSEADARYVYRYRYPQLAGESDLAAAFNTTYMYTVSDALAFEVPMLATEVGPVDAQKVVNINYKVTYQDDRYLSLLIRKTVTQGEVSTRVETGHVFTLTGENAGTITSLPYMAGLLKENETDEWLLERQTNKADNCVRSMVWKAMMKQQTNGIIPIYEDLTYEEFEAGFYPEEDFYLTEDGAFAFYLQPGSVAPEEEGLLVYVITMEDLLDEL